MHISTMNVLEMLRDTVKMTIAIIYRIYTANLLFTFAHSKGQGQEHVYFKNGYL